MPAMSRTATNRHEARSLFRTAGGDSVLWNTHSQAALSPDVWSGHWHTISGAVARDRMESASSTTLVFSGCLALNRSMGAIAHQIHVQGKPHAEEPRWWGRFS